MNIGEKLMQGLKRFATKLERGEPIMVTTVSRRLRRTDARLTPPPMEEVTVPVRFKYIGDEAPRIQTEDCE